jgi:undecaprenyl diphosphate synthase
LSGKTRAALKPSPDPDTLRSSGAIPAHIAIIMDGNGRWAKSKGMPRAYGHREGVRSVKEIVEACGELGVKYLTLYAFSTENWKRPLDEVSMLMGLLVNTLHKELNNLHENNVRLITMGELGKLPKNAQQELRDAVTRTRQNTGLTLNLALSYSGRWDLVHAMRTIAADARRGKISPEDIDEKLIKSHLSTAQIPDPDLLIRTSGELRISNFLLWELAYTEIYICSDFWPAFRRPHLYEAIASYQTRERRFGQVSEQVRTNAKRPSLHKEQSINVIPSL